MTRCAFTGHRQQLEELDLKLLDRVVLNLIKGGAEEFLCGMAVGFDLLAAETVLKYRKKYPVRLVACLPCEGQDRYFDKQSARKYEKILAKCDDKIILSPTYFNGCMQMRDRFLVDNCDVLVSFLRKKSGGTYYTVNYAKRKGAKIIEL